MLQGKNEIRAGRGKRGQQEEDGVEANGEAGTRKQHGGQRGEKWFPLVNSGSPLVFFIYIVM